MTNSITDIIAPYKGNYYDDYVNLLPNFPKIIVGEKKYKKIYDHVSKLEVAKMQEAAHKRDNKAHFKRHFTGILGEGALENYLQIAIIDYTISHSSNHAHADLIAHGFNVGIKTVEYGKLPLVEIGAKRPEVILIKKQNEPLFWLCGVFMPDVLRKYSDTSLILDKNIVGKTCFYALNKGIMFTTLEELKIIVGKEFIL